MGLVRISTADHGGCIHDVAVDDPDDFVARFVRGERSPDTWLQAIDGVAIQTRHITRLWVWPRDEGANLG